MKALFALGLFAALLIAGASAAAATPGSGTPVPSAAATPTWPYTLYGNAVTGWGLTNSSSTITSPGPTLTVTTGDILSLKLVSADGQTHDWFIDADNNSAQGTSEVHSANVTGAGPVWYNLTVTLAAGTYAYRCAFHPGKMWGLLVVQAAPTYTLWGSAATSGHGWGLTSTSITYPGPNLTATQGKSVSIDLFSADGADHTFYVDFARSNSTTGNTVSPDFNGSHPIRFTFVPGQAGNFTYACGIHGAASMMGTLKVASSGSAAAPPDYTIYAAIIVVVVIIGIASAVVIRRKPRTPPEQPPEQPPQ